MRASLFPLLLFLLLSLACNSQRQIATEEKQTVELDETADWRGNPDTQFYVHLILQGPLFPDSKTFYLYLQPKEGIYQLAGRNYLIIQDEISPYPTTFRLQLPRLDQKTMAINPDPQNATSHLDLIWRQKGYSSDLLGGEFRFTMMTPDKRVVQGEFNSQVVLDGQEHQLSGEFLVESFLRQR